MSNEAGQDAAGVVTEAQNPAVTTETVTTPEVDTQATAEESTAEVKTFTQDELNDIIKKEKAKAEAKAERRVMRALEKLSPQQAQQQYQAPQQDARPTRREGEADDAYVERVADWKLDQRERASQQQRAQEQTKSLATKTERMYAEAAKLPGFDREEFDSLPLTPVIAEALVESDQTAKLMAFMSANPEEVARIASLSPARQAAEIGKLEAKVSASPKPSKAPPPINPIGSRGGGSAGDPASMSVDQWAAHMKKQGSRWVR